MYYLGMKLVTRITSESNSTIPTMARIKKPRTLQQQQEHGLKRTKSIGTENDTGPWNTCTTNKAAPLMQTFSAKEAYKHKKHTIKHPVSGIKLSLRTFHTEAFL